MPLELLSSFYCTEVSGWDVGGSATARVSRTQPNTNFGNLLPGGLADISAVVCTEWHSFQGNGSTQKGPQLGTTTPDLYHGDIVLGFGIVIFILSMVLMGLVFNTFYGRR